MRIKLHHLREHKAQGFVKNIPEEESYVHRLALERSKKICDPDVYLRESQHALDKFISQADLVFQTKPLTYASKEAKCLYAAAFLGGIPKCEWVAENEKIKADLDWGFSYLEFVAFLQKRKLPAYVRTANFIVRIGHLQQRNNQSVSKLHQ